MKRLLALFMVVTLSSVASSLCGQTASNEEYRPLVSLYFGFNQIEATEEEFAKLDSIVVLLNGDSTMRVLINGYGDPQGGVGINEQVSLARAKAVAEYLQGCSVSESQISLLGCGIDTSTSSNTQARRVDISQIITTITEPAVRAPIKSVSDYPLAAPAAIVK